MLESRSGGRRHRRRDQRLASRRASPNRELELDAADREAIQAVLRERRGPHGDVYSLERDRSGRHGRIMKYDLHQKENFAT